MEIDKKEDTNNFFNSWLNYTKKHWYLFILGLVVLYVLISDSSLKYGIMCIILGILTIFLSYKKSSIFFEGPFNAIYILVFGEKGLQFLLYFIGLVLIIAGILLLTIP